MPVGVQARILTQPTAETFTGIGEATTFMVGLTERGVSNTPKFISSLAQFEELFGGQVAYSEMYQAVRWFYAEGGGRCYVSRAVGAAATAGTVTITGSLLVTAKEVGAHTTGWQVVVEAGNKITIRDASGVALESFEGLATTAAIAAAPWSTVTIAALSATMPTAATYIVGTGTGGNPGTVGTDDRANADWTVAVNSFSASLGDGVLITPGMPATTVVGAGTLGALCKSHGDTNKRAYIAALAKTSTVTDARNYATANRNSGARNTALVYPWATGADGPLVVRVSPDAVLAAKIHVAWGIAGPGRAAAGEISNAESLSGVVTALTDAEVSAFTDTDQIIPLVVRSGSVQFLGTRSLSTVPAWRALSTAMLANRIAWVAEQIGQKFLFAPIDGKGRTITAFASRLKGYMQSLADTDTLYANVLSTGEIVDEGYRVDVGPTVNTPATLALGQLRARIYFRPSPTAEFIYVDVINVGPSV